MKSDRQARVIWTRLAWEFSGRPVSPTQVQGWRTHLDAIPACELKAEAEQLLADRLVDAGTGSLIDAGRRVLSARWGTGEGTPEPMGSLHLQQHLQQHPYQQQDPQHQPAKGNTQSEF